MDTLRKALDKDRSSAQTTCYGPTGSHVDALKERYGDNRAAK